jgi:hypothetical protein
VARRFEDHPTLERLLPATRQALRDRLVFEWAHTEGGVITAPPVLRTLCGRWHHLTPEIGRLLQSHALPIHRRLMDVYVDHHRPAWWLAWGPELLWRNETPFAFPSMSHDIFAARALVLQHSSERLAPFVDVPWCHADEYYIQKLALRLRAASRVEW